MYPAFDTKHVGSGKTLTAGGAVNDGNGGNNYSISYVTNAPAGSRRGRSPSRRRRTRTYEATVSSAASPLVTTGSVAPETAARSSRSTTRAGAGTGKTLTASGAVSDGNGGNNYAVTFVPTRAG